jgi:conjugal transfer/entry exclusion protein
VFAFNLAMLIVPIVSNALSPEQAVEWAAILNGVAVVARTGLKLVAVGKDVTGVEPQPFNPQVTVDVQQLAEALATQLQGDLAGQRSPEQMLDQLAQDLPTIKKLVADAQHITTVQPPGAGDAQSVMASAADGSSQAG